LLSFPIPRRFSIWFEKEEDIKQKIKENKILIVLLESKILGHLSFEKYPHSIDIDTIIVDKKHRKQGLGRKLVDYFIQRKLDPNIKEITTGSYKCFKDKGFYIKMGFKEVLPEEYEIRDWWEFTRKIGD
jgi:GNAT superfamily N-acetyltransferase